MFVVLRGSLEIEELNDLDDSEEYDLARIVSTGGAAASVTHHWSVVRLVHPRPIERSLRRQRSHASDRIVEAANVHAARTRIARLLPKHHCPLSWRDFAKAKRVLGTISPMIRILDLTVWVSKEAGDVLVEEKSRASFLYLVLHGRLRATKRALSKRAAVRTNQRCRGKWSASRGSLVESSEERKPAPERVIAEYGRGATVGEVPLVTGTVHPATVRVARDTQPLRAAHQTAAQSTSAYPKTMLYMSKRVTRNAILSASSDEDAQISQKRAVAIFPASASVNLDLFARTLSRALNSMGVTSDVLSSHRLLVRKSVVGGSTIDHFDALSQINDAEESHDLCMYLCDPEVSVWSKLCIEQADLILIVGNANDDPKMNLLETQLHDVRSNAERELVLLYHGTDGVLPLGTRRWVENRGNIKRHHHVRVHDDSLYDVQHFKSDFRRLGRYLTGNSVGVVLGGGGARGMSHVSVLRALEEAGIPVDYVGGTSIGAFMGALYASKTDSIDMYRTVARFARGMGSVWKQIRDLTLPITSYFTGLAFNRIIVSVFEDLKIEDFFLPFFCVTTDLTDSAEKIHQNGSAWRYIRASMTLTGYLPPICDTEVAADGQEKTHFLVDGGYVNELPVM